MPLLISHPSRFTAKIPRIYRDRQILYSTLGWNKWVLPIRKTSKHLSKTSLNVVHQLIDGQCLLTMLTDLSVDKTVLFCFSYLSRMIVAFWLISVHKTCQPTQDNKHQYYKRGIRGLLIMLSVIKLLTLPRYEPTIQIWPWQNKPYLICREKSVILHPFYFSWQRLYLTVVVFHLQKQRYEILIL